MTWTDNDSYDSLVAGDYTFTAVLGAIPAGYKDDTPEAVVVTVTVADTLNIALDGTTILGRHNADDGTYGQNAVQLSGGDLSMLTDGTKDGNGAFNTNLQTNQQNFAYGFVGTTWSTARTDQVRTVKLTINAFGDGGWFEDETTTNDPSTVTTAPVVQTTTDGTTWTVVPQTNDYLTIMATFGNNTGVIPEITFDLTDSVTGITGIRVFGENGGNAGTNGFVGVREIEVISSIESVTPAIGLEVSLADTELVWTVEEEIGVKEYQVIVDGKLFDTVVANGSDFYTVDVPADADVKLVVIDESGFSDSYVPADGNVSIEVYDLEEGWNLIAITSDNADLETLKDETVGVIWGWNGTSYEVIDSAKATDAVWVYSTVAKQVYVSGTKSDAEMALSAGWNMIGPVANDYIPAEADTVYSWNDVYDVIAGEEKVLIGGKGYWIFSL